MQSIGVDTIATMPRKCLKHFNHPDCDIKGGLAALQAARGGQSVQTSKLLVPVRNPCRRRSFPASSATSSTDNRLTETCISTTYYESGATRSAFSCGPKSKYQPVFRIKKLEIELLNNSQPPAPWRRFPRRAHRPKSLGE